jgi:hypothetical protein
MINDVPSDLPGHELVRAGLADLAAGRETASALVIAMAAPRLRRLGYEVPTRDWGMPASHRLYDILSDDGGHDPYSRYNALIRRIVSFSRAAQHASAR